MFNHISCTIFAQNAELEAEFYQQLFAIYLYQMKL